MMPLCPAWQLHEYPLQDEGIQLLDAQIATDEQKVSATLQNKNRAAAADLRLIGSLYDEGGKCVKTVILDVPTLAAGAQYSGLLDFACRVQDYTCKVFLMSKHSMMPLCPTLQIEASPVLEEKIFIKAAQSSADRKKAEVTIANQTTTAAADLRLIGSLYDESGKCVKTVISDVPTLAAGAQFAAELDFACDLKSYACKIFLWNKHTMSPLCPSESLR